MYICKRNFSLGRPGAKDEKEFEKGKKYRSFPKGFAYDFIDEDKASITINHTKIETAALDKLRATSKHYGELVKENARLASEIKQLKVKKGDK